MFEFTQNPHGSNQLMKVDDSLYVSFNSRPGGDLSFFGGDSDEPETALVIDGKYFILNGDFREEYRKAAEGGIEAMMAVFTSNPDKHSTWTTDSDPLAFIAKRLDSVASGIA
jgi:hypothetical protein